MVKLDQLVSELQNPLDHWFGHYTVVNLNNWPIHWLGQPSLHWSSSFKTHWWTYPRIDWTLWTGHSQIWRLKTFLLVFGRFFYSNINLYRLCLKRSDLFPFFYKIVSCFLNTVEERCQNWKTNRQWQRERGKEGGKGKEFQNFIKDDPKREEREKKSFIQTCWFLI